LERRRRNTSEDPARSKRSKRDRGQEGGDFVETREHSADPSPLAPPRVDDLLRNPSAFQLDQASQPSQSDHNALPPSWPLWDFLEVPPFGQPSSTEAWTTQISDVTTAQVVSEASSSQQVAETLQFQGEASARERQGSTRQPRQEQQPTSAFEDHNGWFHCYSKTVRLFKSPAGVVYATTNVSLLARRMGLPPKTLQMNFHKWKELKGEQMVAEDTIINWVIDPCYAFLKDGCLFLTDNCAAFARAQRCDHSTIFRVWNGERRSYQGWSRPDEGHLTAIADEGITLKPWRNEQKQDLADKKVEFVDHNGWFHCLYKPCRLFVSPEGEVYATANVSQFENLKGLKLGTLGKGYKGWKELKGEQMVAWDTIKFDRLTCYAFQNKDGDIFLTDNCIAFARARSCNQATMARVWNGEKRSHKGWSRPDEGHLTAIADDGITLKPWRNEQQQDLADKKVEFVDSNGWRCCLYKPCRLFVSPEGEVYATANVSQFENLKGLKPSTLGKGYKGWKELKGEPLVAWDTIKFDRLTCYAFQNKDGDIFLTDNCIAFARAQSCDHATLSRVWHGEKRSHKGWSRPDEGHLAAIKNQGIILKPWRKEQQPTQALD
jgi:hypothetical protein